MSSRAKDGFEALNWIDRNFIENLLRNNLKDLTIKVCCYKFSTLVSKGESYSSIPIRLCITYKSSTKESHTLYIVVKAEAPNVLTHVHDLNAPERYVYEKVLPAIYKLFGDSPPPLIAPRYYASTSKTTIFFDDVTDRGYQMRSRLLRLDLTHAKEAVKALARFHAGTMAIHVTQPELVNELQANFFSNQNKESIENYYGNPILLLARVVKEWPGFEDFSEPLQEKANKVAQILIDVREKTKFLGGVHGDCWSNNILFQYENDQLKEVCLIDFQLFHWASSLIDVVELLYSSMFIEDLERYENEIYEFYKNELNSWLDYFKIDRSFITSDFIKSEVERIRPAASILPLSFLTMILKPDGITIEYSELEDMNFLKEGGEWEKITQDKLYREEMEKVLLHCRKYKFL